MSPRGESKRHFELLSRNGFLLVLTSKAKLSRGLRENEVASYRPTHPWETFLRNCVQLSGFEDMETEAKREVAPPGSGAMVRSRKSN